MLLIFTLIFVVVSFRFGIEDYRIFIIPPVFLISFLASKYFKNYSDYIDGAINVLVMYLVTDIYKQNTFKYLEDLINFFIGQVNFLDSPKGIQSSIFLKLTLSFLLLSSNTQFSIILFVVYRGNNFLINLLSLLACYAIAYYHLSSSAQSVWIALAFSILVVMQNYASCIFKRKTYLHKSYFKEILQLDFPMNIFLTQYDKVTCRLTLSDCNKLAYKHFRIDQDDQDSFPEFLNKIRVQQRRKSRSYFDNMNTTPDKDTTLKDYLISKYLKLNEELLSQKKNCCFLRFPCFTRKRTANNEQLHNFLHGISSDNGDINQNLQRSVFTNENLYGYYYKRRDDTTYSKSFKIHMQLIDFYKEPSIALFFEDETVQNDLVDVKLKKKKQKQLVISALNQVREKVSSLIQLFRESSGEEEIIKQTKQMSILLLNQTFNLFDYIYLKERKKLLQKQQQQILNVDESIFKEQQSSAKFSLNLNLTEFPLKALLKELFLANQFIDIVYSDFGEDTESEIHDYQNCAKDTNIQDFVIYNDYKRILQILLSLTFQESIQISIRQFKEALYSGLEFMFKYGAEEHHFNEHEQITIEGGVQSPPPANYANQDLDLCLNKNTTDKRLKEIDLYVIKTIARDIGPNSLKIDKQNNSVSFQIFSDIRVLQQDDDIKNTKNSQHNLSKKEKQYISLTNRPSQKSITGQISIHNSSFCKTEHKQTQEYPTNTSPAIRTQIPNNHNNQQLGQSPKQSFKIDLRDHFMSKARRSTYSRTLPPSNFLTNNCESIMQSNHNIIDQKQININTTEMGLLSNQNISVNDRNGTIHQPQTIFVKTILSPMNTMNIYNHFFSKKDETTSSNYSYDEGKDLPEIQMSKYLPNAH